MIELAFGLGLTTPGRGHELEYDEERFVVRCRRCGAEAIVERRVAVVPMKMIEECEK